MEYYVPHFEARLPLIVASIIIVTKKPPKGADLVVYNDETMNVVNYVGDIHENEQDRFYYSPKACHVSIESAQEYLVECLFEYDYSEG